MWPRLSAKAYLAESWFINLPELMMSIDVASKTYEQVVCV